MKRSDLKRAKSGALWTAAGAVIGVISQLLIVAVLAIFLTPADVGQFSVFLFVTGLCVTIFPLGNDYAIVHLDALTRGDVRLVLIAVILASIVGLVLCHFMEGLLPYHFGSIARVVNFGVVSGCFESIFLILSAILQRDLEYRRIEVASMVRNVLILVLSLGLVFFHGDIVGAMLGRIAANIVGIGIILRTAWTSADAQKSNFHIFSAMAKDMILKNSLGHISRNAEIVAAGPQLGLMGLGIYDLGRRLVAQPRDFIGTVIFKFTYPMFSKINKIESKVLRARFLSKTYRAAVKSAAVIGFPVFGMALIISDPFVTVLFGPQWSNGIVIVQIFAATAFVQVLGNNLITSALTALGGSRVVLLAEVYTVVPRLAAIYVASFYGVSAVAVVTSLFIIAKLCWMQWELSRRSLLSFPLVLHSSKRPAIASALALALSGFSKLAYGGVSGTVVAGMIFSLIYISFLFAFDQQIRSLSLKVVKILKSIISRSKRRETT